MKKIQINIFAKKTTYPIYIGSNILSCVKDFKLKEYSKIVVITDTVIAKIHLEKLLSYLSKDSLVITIPSGERAKSIECLEEVWRQLLNLGCDRKSLIINLGGGVVGDLGGFAAATFMRGIDYLQIPTTVLSQVDASIGGKTGINFLEIKNLIGAFRQPIGIICDVSILSTLPKREFNEGFGEIIKHGLIADKNYFEFVTSKKPKDFNQKELIEIIADSVTIKKKIVESDVEEKDRRRLVNFGHTIGHAIESLSHSSKAALLHGEAVSIGMIAETKISVLKGMITHDDLKMIVLILQEASLPTKYKFDIKKALEKIKSDKKNISGKVFFTLLSGIGECETGQLATSAQILQALQFIKE